MGIAAAAVDNRSDFTDERLFNSIASAAQRINTERGEHAQRLAAAFAAADLLDLLVDYTRLFLGAPQALAKPCASVRLTTDPGLMQQSVIELQQLYAQGGFAIDEDFRDLPDHVAVELEFLYLLNFQLNQACAADDTVAVQAVEALRTAFLVVLLGCWLGAFIVAVHDRAQSDFYRELAEFTELFVRLEGQQQNSVTPH